jgi:hypothetical protein
MKNVRGEFKGILFTVIVFFAFILQIYPDGTTTNSPSELPKGSENAEDERSDGVDEFSFNVKSLDMATGNVEGTLDRQQDGYSPLNVYSTYYTANVSPQSGSVDADVKDIVLKGKNLFNLEIARHYDTGTAISDAVDSSAWCPGDIAYSVGIGWRLTLPYVKTDTSANWDDRERKTSITLPTGARYSLKEMTYLGGSNPRAYEYHDVDDFRIEFHSKGPDGEYYLLEQRDGTYYEFNRDGLVTTICGRVDSVKGGTVKIFYKPDKTIQYISDTMNRRVYFTYGNKGTQAKPTIVRIDVRDSSGQAGTDPYERTVDFTISNSRLLTQVTYNGIGGVNRSWHYGYVSKRLVEFVNGLSKSTTVFLLYMIKNPENGITKISDGSANDYYQEKFYLNQNDWKERALASGVSTYNEADELLCATKYTYTASRHQSTRETYIKSSREEQIENVNKMSKQVVYTYIDRLKYDVYGVQKVYTLLTTSEACDTSNTISCCISRNEKHYYATTQRIKENSVRFSSVNYRITTFAYDNWGNVTWTKEYSRTEDRENLLVTWVKYADAVYIPPGLIQDGGGTAFLGEEDAPWNDLSPPYIGLPAAIQGPKPHNLMWKKVIKNYYPTVDSIGNVTSLGDCRYHHDYFLFDAERQRTGEAEWNGEEWLYTAYAYYDDGRIAQITNPEGHVTSCSYNDEYSTNIYLQTIKEKSITDADGTVRDITGHIGFEIMSGWIKWKKNPRGYVREYEYDALGRMLLVVEANDDDDTDWMPDDTLPPFRRDNPQTRTQYNDLHKYFDEEDPIGRKTRSYMNNFGSIVQIVQYAHDGYNYMPESVTDYDYDGLDRLLKETKPVNGTDGSMSYRPVTEYRYDAFGTRNKIIHPDGNQVTMNFNYNTNTLAIINERGFMTEEQYDLDDRLIRLKEIGTNTTRELKHYYDGLGTRLS